LCLENDDLWTHVVSDSDVSDETLDFGPVRADVVALVKEAFPDISKIQALAAARP
jgi:hypothetical protein